METVKAYAWFGIFAIACLGVILYVKGGDLVDKAIGKDEQKWSGPKPSASTDWDT